MKRGPSARVAQQQPPPTRKVGSRLLAVAALVGLTLCAGAYLWKWDGRHGTSLPLDLSIRQLQEAIESGDRDRASILLVGIRRSMSGSVTELKQLIGAMPDLAPQARAALTTIGNQCTEAAK